MSSSNTPLRKAKDLNEDDLGKVFMIFENTLPRNNRFFYVESIDPVKVQYASFTGKLTEPTKILPIQKNNDIVEMPFGLDIMRMIRGYTPDGLSHKDREEIKLREKKESENLLRCLREESLFIPKERPTKGGAKKIYKKTRKYSRKYIVKNKSRKEK